MIKVLGIRHQARSIQHNRKDPFKRSSTMSKTNSTDQIIKTICNAIGCHKDAETSLSITIGKRIVKLSFCKDCAEKFQQQ